MARIVLSAHAETVAAEREVAFEWIERTVLEPERIEKDKSDPALLHAIRRVPEFGGRFLRVVYTDRVAPWRVVTVYFDRSLKEKP